MNESRNRFGLLSVGLASIVTTGFIFSRYLWDALALDPTRPSELWRLASYLIVFEPTDYGYLSFTAIVVISFFFLRHAELTLGRARILTYMVMGTLGGAAAYLGLQSLMGGRERVGGESMPAIASILAAISFVTNRKVCLYFFLIPMNVRVASFFTLLLLFLHTAAQTRSAVALIPLGTATILGVAAIRVLPVLENVARRTRELAQRKRIEDEEETRQRVDGILEKIHISGMESLSRDELRILKRASRLLAEHRIER